MQTIEEIEQEFDSMCEEFYTSGGGGDLKVKVHPMRVKPLIRQAFTLGTLNGLDKAKQAVHQAAEFNASNCVDGTDRLWIDAEPFYNALEVFLSKIQEEKERLK